MNPRKRQVSTHSIRCRILKDLSHCRQLCYLVGFNPFDPMQDTERKRGKEETLKAQGFNPFDPMQDTERIQLHGARVLTVAFQPIRSDAGY